MSYIAIDLALKLAQSEQCVTETAAQSADRDHATAYLLKCKDNQQDFLDDLCLSLLSTSQSMSFDSF